MEKNMVIMETKLHAMEKQSRETKQSTEQAGDVHMLENLKLKDIIKELDKKSNQKFDSIYSRRPIRHKTH